MRRSVKADERVVPLRRTRRRARIAELEGDLRRHHELTGDLLCELGLDGRVRRVSDSFASELGLGAGELIGRRLADLVHPDDLPTLSTELNPLLAEDSLRTFDARLRDGAGEWRALTWRARVDLPGGAIHASGRPPGEPGAHGEWAAAFEVAFSAAPIGMAMVAADGTIERANLRLCEITGFGEDELTGRSVEELVHADDAPAQREQIARLVAGELRSVTLEQRLACAGDGHVPATLAVSLVRDAGGRPRRYVVQVQDTVERHDFEEKLRFESEHDQLTGLLNRVTFVRMLAHRLSYARRYDGAGALLMIDVDGLAHINETAGARAGDDVLRAVASVLRERLRDADLLSRLGGDEFGVVLGEVDATAARGLAVELAEAIARHPDTVAGASKPIELGASIGVALFADEGSTPEDLFMHADQALAEAKEAGRGHAVVYDARVRRRRLDVTTRRTWAEKLRAGLQSDAFLLDCQPIVDIDTGQPVQYELLLRLRDDDGAIVRPHAFMAVAERFGLMRAIDEWVIRRAIAIARARADRGEPVTLAVNISGESVGDPTLLPLIVTELIDDPEVGRHLVFEITERTAVEDMEQAKRLIARLSEFGCRFALDDFGAGVGSFHYLKHLPVDYLKLDGEFTRTLPHSREDQEIVRAVVQAARGLGKSVVAECVEDAEILAAVKAFGVDLAQGLHVGRPARASQMLGVGVTPVAVA